MADQPDFNKPLGTQIQSPDGSTSADVGTEGSREALHVQDPTRLAKLEAIRALLADLDLNTDGIEALLTTIDTNIADVEVLLTTISNIDFATETTLSSVSSAIASIDTNIGDIEALLTTIDGVLDNILIKLTSLDGKDFATETTLSAIAVDIAAIEVCLNTIKTDISAIKAVIQTLDFINDGTYDRLAVDIGDPEITVIGTTDVRDLKQKLADDGKMFLSSTGEATISGSGEEEVLLIKNPTGSGVNLRLHSIIFDTRSAKDWQVKYYLNPTITANGTAVSSYNANTGSTNTPQGEIYLAPTVSAFGNRIINRTQKDDKSDQDESQAFDMLLIIAEGDSMLINVVNLNALVFSINIIHAES